MDKKKSIIYAAFKWPWLNFFLAVLFLSSPLILSVVMQGSKGDFNHNFLVSFPSVSRILAFIFVILGFISLYQKNYKKSLYHYQINLKELREINWSEFENLIKEYFTKTGFMITARNNSSEANYRDFEAIKGNHKIVVYCEYWNIGNLNGYPIKEIYNRIKVEKITQLYVVTSGKFTDSAKEFAQGKNIELINGYKLVEWKNFIKV
jgi:restriction system protein